MSYPFGKWLAAALSERELSQSDLLRRLSELGTIVSRQAVSGWCSGTTRPEPEHLVAVFDALSLPAAERVRAQRIHARARSAA